MRVYRVYYRLRSRLLSHRSVEFRRCALALIRSARVGDAFHRRRTRADFGLSVIYILVFGRSKVDCLKTHSVKRQR